MKAKLSIALLVFAGYAMSLWHSFMLDDYVVLFNESGVSNKSFLKLFTDSQHLFFRPVGHIVMWLSYPVFKSNPFGYHLLNLSLFYLVCLLFYKIVEQLFKNKELAFLTAALYTLHPINSMLVNYVTVTVITTFILTLQLSFLCLLKYFDTQRKAFYVGSLFLLVLGLFSHEMSMIYPAYVFCLAYFLKGKNFKQALVLSLPFVLVSIGYFVFRWYFFSLKGMTQAVNAMLPVFSIYISSVAHLIYWYLSKLIMPHNIIFLWTGVAENDFSPFEVFRLLGLIVVVLYFIFGRWKKGLKAFALSIFAVGFIPVFWASYAYFPFSEPLIEPHWFYFSSIGFFILIAQGILFIRDKYSNWPVKFLPVAVLSFFLILLQLNNLNWKDQETYCRFWLNQNKYNTTPFYGLGQAMLARGDAAGALFYFKQGLALSQHHKAFILSDAGYAYYLSGDEAKAQEFWSQAIKEEPEYSATYYYVALAYWEKNERLMAEKYLAQAQLIYPRSHIYRQELARLRAGLTPTRIYPLTFIESK